MFRVNIGIKFNDRWNKQNSQWEEAREETKKNQEEQHLKGKKQEVVERVEEEKKVEMKTRQEMIGTV